jgi:hypothetical protein
MYISLTVILVVLFAAGTLLLPFAYPELAMRVFRRVWRSASDRHRETVFDGSASMASPWFWIRVWGVVAVLTLVVLATFRMDRMDNTMSTTIWLVTCTFAALVGSGFVVSSIVAFGHLFPRALGYQSLARCGVRSLWEVNLVRSKRRFQEELIARINRSSSLSIVDVTGYKLFGKGQGPTGGLLYDALQAARKSTVCLMLYKPDSETRDPDGHATVFQSLLASMNMTKDVYMRRLKSTLDAVNALNEERPAEFKIQVRYYTEKPTLQTLVFDGTAFSYPWQPREDHDVNVPFLEVSKIGPGSSLHESFRLHFKRLWSSPKANGSFFLRKNRKSESKPKVASIPCPIENENPWEVVVRNAGEGQSATVV